MVRLRLVAAVTEEPDVARFHAFGIDQLSFRGLHVTHFLTDTEPGGVEVVIVEKGADVANEVGIVRDLDRWRQIEYVDVRELQREGAAAPARLLAVPYFAWANRGDGGMRVWLPRSD